MQHTHHAEHLGEGGAGPVSRIRSGVSTLVNGVMNGVELAADVGGTVAGRTVRAAGKAVRGFARAIFHR
ncbi:MAG TPA: hypothetical protein DEB30_03480 [Candidatus Peribacter riflensis]|uniref:Uncharacterized protein n=1 Tax=Candidatus Peribacter riflensis TaxID=1735162 RepID=A0A0S1SLF9_9BACT|nr:MAG: hypothetical protein PeribacterA2_0793 [Candidatus Peribacter riflensis]OGJ79061.1 MAG: hypothetical protein A2398_00090 [Candidatus Peribacteria bacterium RIFOXYB1_FULL_57_12]OGJ83140.1 MAG: hypothetical protein A2412_05065 [Candidatus Peribacteria bacterium RIFOXYC1_FULL_58_8]ALM11260.1 MAG: hypothetical protein PeribacterB2_0795 [Candidatus Peribacter riflensis]ALM12362.1 MAG: hypothetical protein PeribacterC2_0794 [Candidatus Peribacter riflensis]